MSPLIPFGYLTTPQVIKLRAELTFGDKWLATNIEDTDSNEDRERKTLCRTNMEEEILFTLQQDLHDGMLNSYLLRSDGDICKLSRHNWNRSRRILFTLRCGVAIRLKSVEGTVLLREDAVRAWLHASARLPSRDDTAEDYGKHGLDRHAMSVEREASARIGEVESEGRGNENAKVPVGQASSGRASDDRYLEVFVDLPETNSRDQDETAAKERLVAYYRQLDCRRVRKEAIADGNIKRRSRGRPTT